MFRAIIGLQNVKYFLLGVGVALGLPPISQVWLSVICLSLLIFTEMRNPVAGPFWRGLCFGFGYFLFALHWIGFAFLVDADAFLWMMPFAVGGLALFMACYWALGFVVARALSHRGLEIWLALPAVLAIIEFLRGYLFTGFPWAAPGLIVDVSGGLMQLASLVGMPGLTFLVLLWGVTPGAAVAYKLQHARKFAAPLLLLVTLPVAWLWGEGRLGAHPDVASDGPIIRLVQPNIAQSDKWRSENANRIFDDLLALTSAASDIAPQVIVWPESAVSFLLDESPVALQRIGEQLLPGQTLLAGSLRRETATSDCAGCPDRYFTSILRIDETGRVTGAYDKWRLVPGGEYLPFAWALEPLGFRKVVNLPESFTAGRGPESLLVDGAGSATLLICYEAIFPHSLVPSEARPDWIVNVTNDGWFGQSVGPYQHLAQVRMRAVEQGLPIARAANTGISAMIDPFGRYVATTALELQVFVDSRLPQKIEPTVFARYGGIGLFLLIVLFLSIGSFTAQKLCKQFPRK